MSTNEIQVSDGNGKLLEVLGNKFHVDGNQLYKTLRNTVFKNAKTDEQAMALCVVANQYGLNPFTKEVYAFPDGNGGITPLVGIDGWLRIINEHPQFDGMEVTCNTEGTEATCKIFRKDRNHPIEITEYLRECKRNTTPWNQFPRRMLRHKAIIQCARIAFGFAGIYDYDEAKDIAINNKSTVSEQRATSYIEALQKQNADAEATVEPQADEFLEALEEQN